MNKSLNKYLTYLRDISLSLLHLNSLGEPLIILPGEESIPCPIKEHGRTERM